MARGSCHGGSTGAPPGGKLLPGDFHQEGLSYGPSPEVQDGLWMGGKGLAALVREKVSALREMPEYARTQRPARPRLEEFLPPDVVWNLSERNQAMARTYFEGRYTQREIADHLGLHFTTVSDIFRAMERERPPSTHLWEANILDLTPFFAVFRFVLTPFFSGNAVAPGAALRHRDFDRGCWVVQCSSETHMGVLAALLTILLFPILPQRYRRRWPWEMPVPEPALVWFTVFLHFLLSVLLWGFAFTDYQKAFGDRIAEMLADPQGSGEVGPITLYGIIGFFAFFFTLKGFLAWIYLLDSVFRFVVAATITGFMGSGFVTLPLLLFDWARGGLERAQMVRTYGRAEVPDRIIESEGGLLVRANRPHPEWHGLLGFHFKGSLYRLEASAEIPEGTRRCFEYRFGPWPDSEIVRRIVILGQSEP